MNKKIPQIVVDPCKSCRGGLFGSGQYCSCERLQAYNYHLQYEQKKKERWRMYQVYLNNLNH